MAGRSSRVTDRERAYDILRRITDQSLYASLVLIGESGFVRASVMGVLRWRSRLDFAIAHFAGRSINKLDRNALDILRLGAHELMFMDSAPYAVVSESVNLAGRHAKRARGFVNAVMRRIAEGPVSVPDDLATRTAHPQWLIDRWTRLFGAERATAIAEANQELSYPDVLLLGDATLPDAQPSSLVDGVVRLQGSTADLDRASFYPMDEGSAVIAAMARATSDDVLDLAAAPGSKTLYMTSRGARVVSNDISIARLRGLSARHRVVSDARKPPFCRKFGTVLLDAPCSATGTIRKNPEIKWRLRETDLPSFARLQKEMLTSAFDLASGYVVYSTCSLEPEENDAIVAGYKSVDAAPFVPEGARQWVHDGVLRLTPESGADGFTAFVLRAM
jgi:16S rRNA (cytosine967-C5)-methyltransferase